MWFGVGLRWKGDGSALIQVPVVSSFYRSATSARLRGWVPLVNRFLVNHQPVMEKPQVRRHPRYTREGHTFECWTLWVRDGVGMVAHGLRAVC